MRKVLFLIDDDEITLLTIEKKFAKYSELFSMVTVKNRPDAVKAVEQAAISLVVLDLDIPQLEGTEFLSQLQQKYPDVPIIAVTTEYSDKSPSTAEGTGVVASISKPFDIDNLGNEIISTLQSEADGGIMHNISPVVFLQLIQMEGKTCTIRLIDNSSNKGGTLYFKDGLMVDARADELHGIQAAYKVITWENVTLFIKNKCTSPKNLINRSLQAIILKAMSLKDESHDSPGTAPLREPDSENLPAAEKTVNFQEDIADFELFEDLEDVVLPELTDDTATNNALYLKNIKAMIHTQLGERCGVKDIYHDNGMDNTLQFLTELGAMFRIGSLKVGYISQDEGGNRILLPGDPVAVLDVSSKCPHDKLMQMLNHAFG
jgi:CheY-like chemotaxis protein